MINTRNVCLLLWLVVGGGTVTAIISLAEAAKPEPDPTTGRTLYLQSCARCHGVDGKGDGPDAKRLYPKPRDLTSGVFKFRSTASGTAPTDEDLFHTMTSGLPPAGMPDWQHLDEAARWQLVHYVKGLSSVFQDSPPQPLDLGRDPGAARADLKQGQAVYEKLGCAACHGATGRGNGPSAASLTDAWGLPVRPVNLTQGWNYRGGSDPKAIVQRVLTGIDGSPMPSYAEAATPEDVWQLAYYVRSLQEEPRWGMVVRVLVRVQPLPTMPDDARWQAIPQHTVWVRHTVDAQGALSSPQAVTAISFQVAADGQTISFRLSWYDPSQDQEDPPDAVALILRPEGVRGDTVTLQTWPLTDSPALDLCVWSAKTQETHEAISKEYDSLLAGSPQAGLLTSQAKYQDGEWVVALTRPRQPAGLEGAATLASGQLIPVAFAVWDGGSPGQRAISTWVDLLLEEGKP